jgi:galactokinase
LDTLVEIAAGHPACLGARLTGAGFGGCTVNLVDAAQAPVFREHLTRVYFETTGRKAVAWISRAADGAGLVNPPPD